MSVSPNCIHNYSLHEVHTFHTHEALVMFTLKEGSHSVLSCFIPASGGFHDGTRIRNPFNMAICILLLHFCYSALHKKKMTMVLVEVPGIACYLPSLLVQNIVQLSVTWERGGKKKSNMSLVNLENIIVMPS